MNVNTDGFVIKDVFVEYQKEPLGLDESAPRFSWLLGSGKDNTVQTAYRIDVRDIGGRLLWNSGRIESGCSVGVEYGGEALSPCTAYDVSVEVWDNYGNCAKKASRFETGFMDGSMKPWEGACWIGAPRFTVCAENRGVFSIESTFRLEKGSTRAGIVFGANDYRLLDRSKNELGLEGENYIRFEINLAKKVPSLDIYRVGYALQDRGDVPFASVPIVNFEGKVKHPVITEENKYDFHRLTVEVEGNCSRAYIDGTLVDALIKQEPWGPVTVGRVLNPRGHNDVITYPRLNEIGFFAGEGSRAYFKDLRVRNLRAPGREFIRETPSGNLYGERNLFWGRLEVREDCFFAENTQVTADPSNTSLPMFRLAFLVDPSKKLSHVRLYITSRGIYDCMANGHEITERLLAPGLTQYDKRMNYQTYDITGLVKGGKNAIGVTLAPGWWSEAQTFTVKNFNYFGDREAFLAKLVVAYEDGGRLVRVTNTKDWKYFGKGPYTYSGFFAGEHFDGRKAWIYRDYSKPEFNDALWGRPEINEIVPIKGYEVFPKGFGRKWPDVHETVPVLTGGYDAPVYIVERRTAQSRKKLEEGIYIYDMGQEMAGVPRITFHEKEGTKIIIRFAEMLYPEMEEYAQNKGSLLLENYRDATSTDVYICSGSDDTYQPRFTFHGYRYIEVSGVTRPPQAGLVESLQYSSVTDFVGSFDCSDPYLTRFAQNVKWSQLSNFINIPTDCPQRNERMGWAGDTHVFCHTALQNSHLKLFYERNLEAMADLQTSEGQFPEIAPIGGGFGGITYECASIFVAWELYQQYGDMRTLSRFYPGMKNYMAYMEDKGLPGGSCKSCIGPLGDWLAPEETDLYLIWNAFYYREADIMGRIAGLLGEKEDSRRYKMLSQKIKKFWNRTFVNPENGKTRGIDGRLCDTQTSYALGIMYGVAADWQKAGEHLARKTAQVNYTVRTGFFGTELLTSALCKTGHEAAAYRLMLQKEFPSWLYPVTQGATTIWERWDSYTREKGFGGQNAMNSFNHYSLGSVLSWIYSDILGVRREEENPGFSHFTLKPVAGSLRYARGSVCTPYGTLWCGWEKEGSRGTYTCRIPANTRARVCLPDGREEEIGSGEHSFCFMCETPG